MTGEPGDRFLTLISDADALAQTPMAGKAEAAGARFAERGGWKVAVGFGAYEEEVARIRGSVGFADASPAPKLELHASPAELPALASAVGATPAQGAAGREATSWWCPLGGSRLIVLGDPDAKVEDVRDALERIASQYAASARIVDLTTTLAALTLAGPAAREAIARFCALDLRPAACPVGGFRPGSIARTPGYVLREGPERYLLLFGWALGEHMWSVVSDAVRALGGGPVGAGALAAANPRPPAPEPLGRGEVASHA